MSVVIPSFNQGAFIGALLTSILEQCGEFETEVIVIDGGSTDGTIEILRKRAPQLAYWCSEPDAGQSDALNKGLRRVTGDIVAFPGSDDYYLEGAFQTVIARWREDPTVGAVCGGFVFVDEESRLVGEAVLPRLSCESPADLTQGPPGVYRLHQVSTFYSARALDVVGRWVRTDLNYVMDRELLYRIVARFHIALIDRTLAAFRLQAQSKSTSQILPFHLEFAHLYELSCTGDPTADAQRMRMARFRRSRAYQKHALATAGRGSAAISLLAAVRYDPRLAFRPQYWRWWRRVLRVDVSMGSATGVSPK